MRKNRFMISRTILAAAVALTISNVVFATTRIVSSTGTYKTIQSAINAAADNDVVFVTAGTWRTPDANGIDFKNKRIRVQSGDPNNPTIVAGTIIDGQGTSRLVYIHDANGSFSRLDGFTLINGYKNGGSGANGGNGNSGKDPNAKDATGNGHGGGIYIGPKCNPIINKCVIQNCLVTGGRGGDGGVGADGNSTVTGGNIGGHAGNGTGNGYGGGIYVGQGSKPTITNCTISNNTAKGGVGGNGGTGGSGYTTTPGSSTNQAGSGGKGGNGSGDGIGGGLYCDPNADPNITNCTLSGNIATSGTGGTGGNLGTGVISGTPPSFEGSNGASSGTGFGGGAFHNTNSDPNYLTCTFTSNSATTSAAISDPNYVSPLGGALAGLTFKIRFNSCTVNGNSPGAIIAGGNCTFQLSNSVFSSNTQALTGGAIWTDPNADVNMVNCSFASNTTSGDGGAIYFTTNGILNANNCTFGGNDANTGGAIYGDSGTTVTMNNCALTGNTAVSGGGIYLSDFTATLTSCYFVNNTAQTGAGAYLTSSVADFTIAGSLFENNSATGATFTEGGGLYVEMCDGTVADTEIMQNYSKGTSEGDGGGLYAAASTLTVTDCLLTDNSATVNGGGAALFYYSDVTFGNCTFAENIANTAGGGIFCDNYSSGSVSNSIITSSSRYGIYEEVPGLITPITYNLFGASDYNSVNKPADIYDGNTARTGAANINGNVSGASNNITANPKFNANGPLGAFYLYSNSPAVDAGNGTAASLGLNTRTTQANNSLDSGTVDLGFHYPTVTSLGSVNLKISAPDGLGAIKAGRNGAVNGDANDPCSPSGLNYYVGTIVPLTASPISGYRVKDWTGGTSNDLSTTKSNTVVMVANKTIAVYFEQTRTLSVGGSNGYPTIQDAITAAGDGDTIIVSTGTYTGSNGAGASLAIDKSIILTSSRPTDPCCVASTIVDASGSNYAQRCIVFGPNADESTLVNGFTFINGSYYVIAGSAGVNPGDNGGDGGSAVGGGVFCDSGSKPHILNCVIKNCSITGANGGNGAGASASPTVNAGRGGWGGAAYGGGVYVASGSSPLFQGCTISNCSVTGGNGGNGGDFVANGGTGNYGGLWSATGTTNIQVRDFHYSRTTYLPSSQSNNIAALWQWWGYTGNYNTYTGLGGGVYCDANSSPTFEDCTISNNQAEGGMSGQGGATTAVRRNPVIPYRVPSYGAGVYCATNSKATFTQCKFLNNETHNDPNDYMLNVFIGSGGGVCAEGGETTFTQCTFSDNNSATGGALYCSDANSDITDCNFINNTAKQGGAIYAYYAGINMLNTRIGGNSAVLPTGLGGGIVCFSSDAAIADSNFIANNAAVAGGGLYLSGSGGIMAANNNLFTDNQAGRDGGAVSVDFSAQPLISSCTFSGNTARGDLMFTGGYGGALSCIYGGNTTLKNCILWGDTAPSGAEIFVGAGFDANSSPATVNVSYSDISGGQGGIIYETGGTVNWLAGNLSGSGTTSNPKWVNGTYYLSQTAAGQTSTSPDVNAGTGTAAQLPLGPYRYTTMTPNVKNTKNNDTGNIDIGYHYYKGGNFAAGDLNYDGVVNMADLNLMLTTYWLRCDCGLPDWCGGADLNRDGVVNDADKAILLKLFGAGDTIAPAPDPMTWARAPYSIGPASVAMLATTAMDNSGGPVQYRILRTNPNLTTVLSAWQSDPCFVVTGLTSLVEYGFQVQARDNNGNYTANNPNSGNQTGWSFEAFVVPGLDTSPPTNVKLWYTNVTATGFTLNASAQDATPPITYEFICTSGNGPSSSGFGSNKYIVSGLINDTNYTYVVKAQDSSPNKNTSGASDPCTITTSSSGGGTNKTPPTPNPLLWVVPPTEQQDPNTGMYAHTMTCGDANSVNPPVQYDFICYDASGLSSGWQTSTTYTVIVGAYPHSYRWYVIARDSASPPNTQTGMGNLIWVIY